MKIPYNLVCTHGGVLFAARSGQIHTFNLADGSLISTWKHPDVEKVANAVRTIAEDEKIEQAAGAAQIAQNEEAQAEGEGPPAKRQKTTSDEDLSASKVTEKLAKEDESAGQSGKKKWKKNKGSSRRQHVPNRPLITHMLGTADGKHLLAISGHDKAIWVFEHDGAGNLTQLSQRFE